MLLSLPPHTVLPFHRSDHILDDGIFQPQIEIVGEMHWNIFHHVGYGLPRILHAFEAAPFNLHLILLVLARLRTMPPHRYEQRVPRYSGTSK
jgi:hypothetical protein